MTKTFMDIPYFCATSDVWSRSNRSFIAVSVHYFELNSFQLKTKFIACEHFPGRHTHDKVAEKLNAIFARYGILEKVFFVTTDGGSEYVAAFKYFGDNYRSIHLLNAEEEDLTWLHNVVGNDGSSSSSGASTSAAAAAADADGSSDSNLNQTANEDDLELESDSDSEMDSDNPDLFVHTENASNRTQRQNFVDVDENSDSNSFVIHELPALPLMNANRVDCGAHKLDKLGKIDALDAKRNDPDYAEIHDRVFDKLARIWSLKESRLNAELFERMTGKKLTGPHRIRWLKTFESVSCFFFLIQ